jgi:glycosyltransferase involved in cell wall biosynthesis
MSQDVGDPGLVSITIPTLNSSKTLPSTLESIKSQKYGRIEVIVVDSYSSDSTREIAVRYGAEVLLEEGLVRSRFRGIRACRGEFILLLDADQVLEARTIQTCVEELMQQDADGLVLGEVSEPQSSNRLASAVHANMQAVQGELDFYGGIALPRFFRRTALADLDPPRDELLGFDHVYIYLKLLDQKCRILSSAAKLHHLEYNSLPAFVRKYYRFYGLGFWRALREDVRLVAGRVAPRAVYFRTGLSRREKVDLAGLYLLKAIVVAGAAGMGLISRPGKLSHWWRTKARTPAPDHPPKVGTRTQIPVLVESRPGDLTVAGGYDYEPPDGFTTSAFSAAKRKMARWEVAPFVLVAVGLAFLLLSVGFMLAGETSPANTLAVESFTVLSTGLVLSAIIFRLRRRD